MTPGVDSGSIRDRFGIDSGSIRGRFGVDSGSIRGRFAGSMRADGRSGPTAVPFFPERGSRAAAPRAQGGFGGAGDPPFGGVWGGEAPPGKND